MKVIKIPFDQIDQFSSRDKDYQIRPEIFHDFIEELPQIGSFKNKIEQRKNFPIDRKLLVDHLKKSYSVYSDNPKISTQIESLLDENTFTITTAHQLSLLGGPLYYVLKILSTIHLAGELNKQYPEQHFVPVFVHGAEDHDFEEINHLNIFNQTLEWNTKQSGATGRMQIEDLDQVISELKNLLGTSTEAKNLISIIDDAHINSTSYGAFMHKFVHHLFKEFGLIQLNMDSADLKVSFKDIIEREAIERFSHTVVSESIEKLQALGYKTQASPRDINLFYLNKGGRNRLVWEDNSYRVLNTTIKFSPDDLHQEIKDHPERFSPNVILRPLYQERVLPNLAYVGGGGEIAYWMERKEQFAMTNISYPILIRRNSAGIIDKKKLEQWAELSLKEEALALNLNELTSLFLKNQDALPIAFDVYQEKMKLLYESIASEIEAHDPTLSKLTLAESAKSINSLKGIEGKFRKFAKQKEAVSINRIEKIKQQLFPNGSLQERHTNFMEFYIKKGPSLFEELLPHLNPLEKDFQVFVLD